MLLWCAVWARVEEQTWRSCLGKGLNMEEAPASASEYHLRAATRYGRMLPNTQQLSLAFLVQVRQELKAEKNSMASRFVTIHPALKP